MAHRHLGLELLELVRMVRLGPGAHALAGPLEGAVQLFGEDHGGYDCRIDSSAYVLDATAQTDTQLWRPGLVKDMDRVEAEGHNQCGAGRSPVRVEENFNGKTCPSDWPFKLFRRPDVAVKESKRADDDGDDDDDGGWPELMAGGRKSGR